MRKIVYEPMMLEEIDEVEYKSILREILQKVCYCDECLELPLGDECTEVYWKLHDGWEEYKKMSGCQTLVRNKNWDREVFRDSLGQFTALEEMVLNGRPSPEKSHWLERAFRDTLAIEGEFTDGYEDGADSCVIPLLCLMAGLHKASHDKNILLKTLKLRSIGWSFWEEATELEMFFQQLRTLQLRFAEDFDEAEYETEALERHKNLGKAIQMGSKHLESLDLAFGHQTEFKELVETERDTRVNVLWENIFSNKHFTTLHTLRLQNVTCQTDVMMSFFKNHASTLRVINFKSLWLHEPSLHWAFVFETMRQHLSLDKLFLDGYFGGEPEPDVPTLLNLDKYHSIWLCKTIVYGHKKTARVKQENEERVGKQLEERRKTWDEIPKGYRCCPHQYFVLADPIRDLEHYTDHGICVKV